jgi:hypothetical protein
MTQAPAPEFVEMDLGEFSDEEIEVLTARAKSIGLDLDAYIRVRVLVPQGLPEPSAFFGLAGRLAVIAKEYEACIKTVAGHGNADSRLEVLAEDFAHLLQDWDDLYGPRPDDLEPLPELLPSTVAELPPRDAAEARQRACQAANADAFFANFELPPGTDRAAIRKILDRQNQLTQAHDAFFREMAVTGIIDRPKLQHILADIRAARREFLIAIGKDPDSEDLLSFTATLHDA